MLKEEILPLVDLALHEVVQQRTPGTLLHDCRRAVDGLPSLGTPRGNDECDELRRVNAKLVERIQHLAVVADNESRQRAVAEGAWRRLADEKKAELDFTSIELMTSEQAFRAADTNVDGVVDPAEYAEFKRRLREAAPPAAHRPKQAVSFRRDEEIEEMPEDTHSSTAAAVPGGPALRHSSTKTSACTIS